MSPGPLVRVVEADLEGLTSASKAVLEGGLVSYPTDTVYGLGCDPFNPTAIERVIRVKGDRKKPLPVLVRALQDAQRLADFPDKAFKLVREFWPGPLTIVLKAKTLVPQALAPLGTIGVRSPKHSTCLNLLSLCSGYLVGTSANRTGDAPATTPDEVVRELGDSIDVVVDGGRTTLGVASTVIDLSKELVILREGPIPREALLKCLRKHDSAIRRPFTR